MGRGTEIGIMEINHHHFDLANRIANKFSGLHGVSAIGLGDPDIDFTTPTVTPRVEIDFDPSQTLGDPAISGMLPSTLTATPIVSSVSPTETGSLGPSFAS